jgi:hypothetical protein
MNLDFAQRISTDPLSLFLYACLAVIAFLYFALNLRPGPISDHRSISTIEVISRRTIGRIGLVKWILVVAWVVLFSIVLYRAQII